MLSQWRGYGSKQGYSIKFNKQEIEKITKKQNIYNKKVYYPQSIEDFKNTFYNKKFSESIEDFTKMDSNGICDKDAKQNFIEPIIKSTIFSKHYGFHEEKEYRIAISHYTKHDKGEIFFYNNDKDKIRSYVKFGEGEIVNAIEEVIVGPSEYKQQNKEKIEDLIAQKGLSTQITVTASEIPFI